jgi:hypothetical protein
MARVTANLPIARSQTSTQLTVLDDRSGGFDAFGYVLSNQALDVAFYMPMPGSPGRASGGAVAAVCDADLGFSELNAEIAATATRALRRALNGLTAQTDIGMSMQHALHQASMAAERQIERLIGKRDAADAISMLVIAIRGDTLTIGRLGNGRLWLRRQGWMNAIISAPTSIIGTSEHTLKAGDRIVLSTAFVGDYVSIHEIGDLLQTRASNAEVVRGLVQLADTTGLPQIASAVCLTHSGLAAEPVRALIPIAPTMPSANDEDDDDVTPEASRRRVSDITLAIIGVIALTFLTLMATVALLSYDASLNTTPVATVVPTAPAPPTPAPSVPEQAPIALPPTLTPAPPVPTETPLP